MQARIEGEERVIGDVASPSPSLVSLTLRGYFYGKGGARLISCPEFRTSGNLHPWVHINVEEEQQGRGRDGEVEGKLGRGGGTAAMEERERGGRAKSRVSSAIFRCYPLFRLRFLFFVRALLFFSTARRIENAFQFGRRGRWSTVFIGVLIHADSGRRRSFLSSPGGWKGPDHGFIFIRSEKDDRGGGGHGEGPINFLNVGRKDGRRVIKNKFVVFSEAAALGGFFKEAWRIFRKSLVLCEEKRARAWRCHWKLWRPVHGQKPIIPTHTHIYMGFLLCDCYEFPINNK